MKKDLKISGLTKFKSIKIYVEDRAAEEIIKTKILMNRPAYVGLTIFELSKLLMYKFPCDYIKRT